MKGNLKYVTNNTVYIVLLGGPNCPTILTRRPSRRPDFLKKAFF